MMKMRIEGSFVAPPTPFNEDGSVDFGAYRTLLQHLEDNGTVSVNLRAPVVVNPARMVGQQVIPHNTTYPLRHVLVQGE